MRSQKFNVIKYYKIFLKKYFEARDVQSALWPLTYYLNILGMINIDVKEYPINCIKCFLVVILFSYTCIRVFERIPYKKIFDGYAIDIISICMLLTSGLTSVVIFYFTRFGQRLNFREWFTDVNKIDEILKEILVVLDYFKLIQNIFLQLITVTISVIISWVLCIYRSSWNIDLQAGIAFIFPFLHMSLYYCEYICQFYVILERHIFINTELYKLKYTGDSYHSGKLVWAQSKLCDLSENLVVLNGPIDVVARLISLVITVFSAYNIIEIYFSNSEDNVHIFNLVFGVFCNQYLAFVLLKISQKCMHEVRIRFFL